MKHKFNIPALEKKLNPIVIIVIVLMLLNLSCKKKSPIKIESKEPVLEDIDISEDGAVITMSANQSTKFATAIVKEVKMVVSLKIYARTLAGAAKGNGDNKFLIIFETPELTQLYSNYMRDKAEHERSAMQSLRINALYKEEAVSGREVLDAETLNRQAETSFRDSEGRIRQAGIPPKLLKKLKPGYVLIVADVPEARIDAVSPGEKAEIEFNSFSGKIFKGTVISIADAVSPITRTIRVGILLYNEKGNIRPGMFAKVSIEEKLIKAVKIPASAVFNAEGQSFVFVKSENEKFIRKKVIVGENNDQVFQIISGLKNGEEIVISNVILLKGLSFGY